jgi:hypothetical protein
MVPTVPSPFHHPFCTRPETDKWASVTLDPTVSEWVYAPASGHRSEQCRAVAVPGFGTPARGIFVFSNPFPSFSSTSVARGGREASTDACPRPRPWRERGKRSSRGCFSFPSPRSTPSLSPENPSPHRVEHGGCCQIPGVAATALIPSAAAS